MCKDCMVIRGLQALALKDIQATQAIQDHREIRGWERQAHKEFKGP